MSKIPRIAFFSMLLLAFSTGANAQYNTLFIPDTLSGTTFNLVAKDTIKQMIPGNQTVTAGINGNWWGPTMIWNKGDVVHINLTNKLQDSTTMHWHGMHLPAVMDGGPHQVIPPSTIWQPYWQVTNNAGLFWYHPHLHMTTEEQISSGLGGLIIVRDNIESALPLPRKYGIDDIPLVLTDRRFTSSNQIEVAPYGDTMIVNGTIRPQTNAPAQVVRFRILNGATERSYNLGFSDNRNFYVITSDGGLLNAPVALNRYLLSAGERIEILVDFTGQSGQNVNLMAYNSVLAQNIPGGDVFPPGTPFYNFLARKDFNILRLNVVAQTSNPITSIPTTLTTNVFPNEGSANITRALTISDTTIAGVPGVGFVINHKLFDINYNNYNVPLNNTEIWQITSTSGFAHPFHIHDVEFHILTRNGVAPPAAEGGWKDVLLVKSNETIRFIAKFEDYADSLHPFMYHCHIALHEDDGMMGQFVVKNSSVGIVEGTTTVQQHPLFSVYPNPAFNKLFLNNTGASSGVYYVRITNTLGKTMYMLPRPDIQNGIDISGLPVGIYFAQVTLDKTFETQTLRFIKK
ncbi:MAG: multicopper oxidase domain-containing protein [Bacteroidetes bacterium]|nr:multicopper oxidase domain-containing protein [Bacteroidota bacterium]